MLLPPTLEYEKDTWFWTHRTVTYPVARIETGHAPALFVKIEITRVGYVWDASVVTASGVCVARWSQKGRGVCAPLDWGGKHFGVVDVGGDVAGGGISAKGPTLDVVFAEDLNSKRRVLRKRAEKIMLFTCCFFGLPCTIATCLKADREPYEALFKTSGGAEIGGLKIETYCLHADTVHLPKTEAVVQFGSMPVEQRRLALVTIMQGAAIAAHPPSPNNQTTIG